MTEATSSYDPEQGELICRLISEGMSLRKICTLPDMPKISTFLLWVLKGEGGDERYKKLTEQYVRAREIQADVLFDEIVDIADDSSEDEIFTEDGKRVANSEFLQRSRLRVDTRKWYAGKVRPKKYGEKITQEHVGPDGGPVAVLNIMEAKPE